MQVTDFGLSGRYTPSFWVSAIVSGCSTLTSSNNANIVGKPILTPLHTHSDVEKRRLAMP